MNINHVIAVFKAEYFTTTSKFRSIRKYIPWMFILGVILFSYLLRSVYQLFRGDQLITNPPIPTFFSIIAIFSYFTLFAPLLSPLGRVVYDGGAKSRREVALNAPVASKDLLYGNLLSNLAFFLPFFGFVGTLTLAPFIGNGSFSPLVTALALFGIMSLLIIVGLVAGTLLSPLIFGFIAQRRTSQTRAFVAFAVSAMLILSLPILRYFLENASQTNSLGWITYMPFTLAAVLIIYILYGVQIATTPILALTLLVGYIFLILCIGYYSADTIYDVQTDANNLSSSNPKGKPEKVLNLLTRPLPKNYATIVRATMKASLRDIEHLSRLTIGLSITVFMIFALSSKGLFRNVANFDERIEFAVVIFALILSSTSVIFIEASSFTVQHRDMFALIKSSPRGARKFVIAKAIQMNLLLIPIYISIVIVLSIIGYIVYANIFILSLVVILVMIAMTSLSLAIYLVNPSDNEEDLVNFINLLVFYFFSFAIAVIPVTIVIGGFGVPWWLYIVAVIFAIVTSIALLHLASESLEQMNLETLESPLSRRVIHYFKVFVLFFVTWNLLPLLGLSYLINSNDTIGFILLTYLIILSSVLVYYLRQDLGLEINIWNMKHLRDVFGTMTAMLILGLILGIVLQLIYPKSTISSVYDLLPLPSWEYAVVIVVVVVVEEFFFRGMILSYAQNELSEFQSINLTAVLFALVHLLSPVSFLNAYLQSLLLGKLKTRTKSVLYPVLAHLVYNLTVIYLFSAI